MDERNTAIMDECNTGYETVGAQTRILDDTERAHVTHNGKGNLFDKTLMWLNQRAYTEFWTDQ